MLTTIHPDSKRKLRAAGSAGKIMEQSGAAMVVADPDLPDCPIVAVNQAFVDMTGYSKEESIGRNCRFLQGEGTDKGTVASIRQTLQIEGRAEFELLNYRKDGTPFWCSLHLSPIYDENGTLVLFVSSQRDETARVMARAETEEAYERLNNALSAGRAVGTFDWNVTEDKLAVDENFARVFALNAKTAAEGLPVGAYFEKIDVGDRERVEDAVWEACDRGSLFEEEYGIQGSDGIHRYIMGHGRCRLRPEGDKHFTGVIVDITKRREAELAQMAAAEANALLTREINHRIHNLFALVPAIVNMSARASDNVQDLAVSVQARINALARSHALSIEQSLHGEGIELNAMLLAVLEPYQGSESIELQGPPIRLEREASNAVALTAHELATNAVKYGALASPSAQLRIEWQRNDQTLRIIWEESGVPLDGRPPERRGFGTRLSEALFKNTGGQIEREWTTDGLRITMKLPSSIPGAG